MLFLGNKGKNIQELTAKYSVQIKFPERKKPAEAPRPDAPPTTPEEPASPTDDEDGKNDTILISGKKENAEDARDAIMVSKFYTLVSLLNISSY